AWASMTVFALCGAAERKRFFGKQAGRLFEPAAGGRVPARAEKPACAREAEGQAPGRDSFGTFPGGKKSTRIKKRERIILEKPPHIKFDSDSDFDPDPDSDTDLDKQIKRCDHMVKTVFGQQ
ncbi:MAG: hypothetical protein ACOZBW_05900, partial [Thermodesulfobacteriota bacterium]